MAFVSEDIYRSSNGDRWRLVRDDETGRRFVRHEPNLSSGGNVTDIDVEDFLSIDGAGPEFVALKRMIRDQERASDAQKL